MFLPLIIVVNNSLLILLIVVHNKCSNLVWLVMWCSKDSNLWNLTAAGTGSGLWA